ncbi:MAG: PhoH family protein [Deltaproteobacteria bacterium]|nr:PhoH family protein [Deltaproteobacteria bacterium]MCL5277388.1 PhoH family protein [Deltaproteobacteria bacterium]
MRVKEATQVFESNELARVLFGVNNENLKVIENNLGVRLNVRGNIVNYSGEDSAIELANRILTELYTVADRGYAVGPRDVLHAIDILREDQSVDLTSIFLDNSLINLKKRKIIPKSLNQKLYLEAIKRYDIVIAIGPAGTGKTYLAMAMALIMLIRKEVDRIILTRPAIEAGEKLGFLPGDMFEKVSPYLRPLYDALYDMIDQDRANDLIYKGVIEVAPLAFMRGRTLNDSFIILDEAQNTTSEQMKMFLTRIGFSSRAVVTGDITQIDLPKERQSGLVESIEVLSGIEGIKFMRFSEVDIVRHKLVQEIIRAYESKETSKKDYYKNYR